MSRGIRLQIELKQRDRRQVDQLLGGGLQGVRTTLRALRYLEGGLERALFDAARPGNGLVGADCVGVDEAERQNRRM